jgi:organic hydroperoxide reductase OsmC/OhrA
MTRAAHKAHTFEVNVSWTGNTGEGTSAYRAYERAHHLCFIAGSVNFEVRAEPT